MDESRRTPSGESSGTNDQQPPPVPPGPSSQQPGIAGYPSPAIGYPATAIGYPAPPDQRGGIPPPYPSYSNQTPYNMQQNPQPENYYTYQNYASAGSSSNLRLVRVLLMCMILLVIFSSIGSIIMYFIARTQIPVFHVASFSVSNLNVSADSFSAVWEANVTMENRFDSVDFHFDHIQSNVFLDNDILASSSVEHYVNSITVPKKEKGTIPAKVAVVDSRLNAADPEEELIEELRKKRKKGSVDFNLLIYLWTSVKDSSWRTRHWKIGVLCSDITTEFDNGDSPNGKYQGKPKECISLF